MDRLGPVIASTAHPTVADQAAAAAAALEGGADRAECRLDALAPGEDPAALFLMAHSHPLLISGSRDRLLPSELPLFRRAQESGAWVDLPWSPDLPEDLFGLAPERLVLSFHDFESTPPDLNTVLEGLRARPAAACKLVTTARDFPEAVALRALLAREGTRGDLCAFAMGAPGVLTRALALAWGSAAVYASAPGSQPTGPGQVGLGEFLEVYRPKEAASGDPLYALVGWPLTTSRSPALFNAWLGAAGLRGRYVPAPSSDPLAVLGEEGLSLAGVAVTVPHKEAVLAGLSATSRLVKRLGACNTCLPTGNGWLGANTDVWGLRCALRAVPRGSRCLILGAGGAAAAAAMALRGRGALAVTARDDGKARAFGRRFGAELVPWRSRGSAVWDLLVNATPSGQEGEASPMPPGPLSGRWVMEMVVRQGGTPLARDAMSQGLEVFPGEAMLVPQARLQFRLWTGRRPPRTAS